MPRQGLASHLGSLRHLRREPTDFDAAMSDMRIIPPVRRALQPLESVGYQLVDTEIEGIDFEKRQVTVIHGGVDHSYLVHLPRQIVHTASYASSSLIASLNLLFPAGSQLYLISQDADAIELSLQIIVNQYATVKGRFVRWRHLRGKGGAARPVSELLSALQLSTATGPQHQATDLRVITPDERTQISSVFAGLLESLPDAEDAYSDFVRSLDLNPKSASRANSQWNPDVNIAANNLIGWVVFLGNGALGRFLSRLVEETSGRPEAPDLLKVLRECCGIEDQLMRKLTELVGTDQR